MEIEKIKQDLEGQFPEYEFRLGKRVFGPCVIAKNTRYSGADIFYKNSIYTIEASIPDTKTRLLLGSGAVFLKWFSQKYAEPSNKIYMYLKGQGKEVKMRM